MKKISEFNIGDWVIFSGMAINAVVIVLILIYYVF